MDESSRLSESARTLLRKEWQKTVRHLAAAERESWLRRVGLIALGAAKLQRVMKEIRADRELIQSIDPSGAWSDNWESTGERIPARHGALQHLDRRRDYSSVATVNGRGMKLSRGAVQLGGSQAIARRRLLPPQANDEAIIDAMDCLEAATDPNNIYWPPCVCLQRLHTIRMLGGREQRRKLRLGGRDPYKVGRG